MHRYVITMNLIHDGWNNKDTIKKEYATEFQEKVSGKTIPLFAEFDENTLIFGKSIDACVWWEKYKNILKEGSQYSKDIYDFSSATVEEIKFEKICPLE